MRAHVKSGNLLDNNYHATLQLQCSPLKITSVISKVGIILYIVEKKNRKVSLTTVSTDFDCHKREFVQKGLKTRAKWLTVISKNTAMR